MVGKLGGGEGDLSSGVPNNVKMSYCDMDLRDMDTFLVKNQRDVRSS